MQVGVRAPLLPTSLPLAGGLGVGGRPQRAEGLPMGRLALPHFIPQQSHAQYRGGN